MLSPEVEEHDGKIHAPVVGAKLQVPQQRAASTRMHGTSVPKDAWGECAQGCMGRVRPRVRGGRLSPVWPAHLSPDSWK